VGRFRSCFPSSKVIGVAQLCYSALSPSSLQSALVFPWVSSVSIKVVPQSPPSFLEQLCSFQLLGGAITPSMVLPFRIRSSLVNGAYPSPGNPLILRAWLSDTLFLLCVPLPSMNAFLSVFAVAPGSTPSLWFLLSAVVECMVSRGLQPSPQSACLDVLISFPDWDGFATLPFLPASAQWWDLHAFCLESRALAMGAYTRYVTSIGVPAGITRYQLGLHFYGDDVVLLSLPRPLLLPLLVALSGLPCAFLQGSRRGPALAPEVYLQVLQLLLFAASLQLA